MTLQNRTNEQSVSREPLLVGSREAARLTSMSLRSLQSLTSSGAIPSRKVNGLRRYVVAELEAWVRAGCPTTPGAGNAIREAVSHES